MAVTKTTQTVKDAIKNKSAYAMNDYPTQVGETAEQIKAHFWKPVCDTTDSVQTELDRIVDAVNTELDAKGSYSKPATGIPKTDLAEAVQTSLDLADSALQSHQSLSGYYTKTETYSQSEVDSKMATLGGNLHTNDGQPFSSASDLPTSDVAVHDYAYVVANSTTSRYSCSQVSPSVTWVKEYDISTDIASGSITTAKIADANVTTAKIADANITTAKIADGNVTKAKLATAVQTSLGLADTALQSHQSLSGYYTKTETDSLIAEVGTAIKWIEAGSGTATVTISMSSGDRSTHAFMVVYEALSSSTYIRNCGTFIFDGNLGSGSRLDTATEKKDMLITTAYGSVTPTCCNVASYSTTAGSDFKKLYLYVPTGCLRINYRIFLLDSAD